MLDPERPNWLLAPDPDMTLTAQFLAAIGLVSLLTISAPVSAQSPPIAPLGEIEQRKLDSGPRGNPDVLAAPAVVFSNVVATPDARWTRLYFSDITLEGDSRIRFTSMLDGQVQELDAAGVAMWSNTSAYFNGPVVLVELIASPGSAANRFVLSKVAFERIPADGHPISSHCTPPLECGICDGDDRVPSTENWACRLVSASGGCSAAIFSEDSCVVSAGHCMGNNMVIQFNVPLSNPDCTINHPPVEDQFPILEHIAQNGGVGADWAVMTSGTNDLGQTAFDRFGEYRPIATTPVNLLLIGSQIDIWGYGVTDECTLRQTQQYSTGGLLGVDSAALTHTGDTTCGNSGSSVLFNGEIIGIVSHCTFSCPSQGNTATRIDLPAFVAARNSLCGPDVEPVDVNVPEDYPTIQAAIDAAGHGSTITVAPGTYSEAVNFNGKLVTVVSSDGPEVTIIDATGFSASVVRFSAGETNDAVLDGFTLTGGSGSDVVIGGSGYNVGGAIYAAGASPTIRNCILADNTAQFGGGVFNNNAATVFENCTFQNNTSSPSSGGGVFNFGGSTPQFTNTMFIGNSAAANGGGMSNQGSSPLVINSQFINNTAGDSGGAVRNIQSSAGQFIDCTFENNSAGETGGAIINSSSASTLIADSTFCASSPNNIAGNFTDGGGNTFLDECPVQCALADLNCDGSIDVFDLLELLGAWGPCDDCSPGTCPGDLDGDCTVDVFDLLILLGAWN